MGTITITRVGGGDAITTGRYRLEFSRLPGQPFGPYPYADVRAELMIHTGLPAVAIRNLILDAWAGGRVETGQG